MDLSGIWHDLMGRKAGHGRPREDQDHMDLHDQVNAAHREWVTAQQYFQSVSDPGLVDHAVHSIIAAEQKYMYLLRKMRETHGDTHGQGE